MGFPKALLVKEGKLIVQRMIEDLRQSGWGRIGIVLSSVWLSELFHKLITDVAVIINRNPEAGMISSIRLAIAWTGDEAEGMLTLPVDHPLISLSTLEAIRVAASRYGIIVPTCKGQRGHPTWWGRDCWELLLSPITDEGANRVLHSSNLNVVELPVDDKGVLININKPADAAEYNLVKYEP